MVISLFATVCVYFCKEKTRLHSVGKVSYTGLQFELVVNAKILLNSELLIWQLLFTYNQSEIIKSMY